MFTKLGVLGSVMAFALTTTTPVFAGTAEVIHWWTTGGEAAALRVLVDAYQKTGNQMRLAAHQGYTASAKPRNKHPNGDRHQ